VEGGGGSREKEEGGRIGEMGAGGSKIIKIYRN
jgi:hypothetical protein